MVKKASKKIWLLRRMRSLGVDQYTVAAYWKSEGICHLEYCSPVWSSALTKQQQQQLARVHRRAVAAISGIYAVGEEFEEICSRLGLEADLGRRRLRLAQRFAERTKQTRATRTCSCAWKTHPTHAAEAGSGGSRPAAPRDTCSRPFLTASLLSTQRNCTLEPIIVALHYCTAFNCNIVIKYKESALYIFPCNMVQYVALHFNMFVLR